MRDHRRTLFKHMLLGVAMALMSIGSISAFGAGVAAGAHPVVAAPHPVATARPAVAAPKVVAPRPAETSVARQPVVAPVIVPATALSCGDKQNC